KRDRWRAKPPGSATAPSSDPDKHPFSSAPISLQQHLGIGLGRQARASAMHIVFGNKYYGEKNYRYRYGVCDFCRTYAMLASFDAREFIHVYYVPIYSVGRLHVFDRCGNCRNARRMTYQTWEGNKLAAIDEAQIRTHHFPDDVQAWIGLHRAYV